MLSIVTRLDTWATFSWRRLAPVGAFAQRHRYWFAVAVIVLSVADLLLTQTILTTLADKTHILRKEQNSLMAPIIMSWWAWPVRVGIPLLIVMRDLRRGNHHLLLAGVLIYAPVVLWNSRMLYLVVTG